MSWITWYCPAPPATITIKGTSLPFSAPVRQTKKNKAWENTTLSAIANELAGANGMSCMYESAYDPFYKRVEQVDASDIDFLSRLCHDAGISLKATSSILVFFDPVAYEAKSSVITIEKGAADSQYASCRVSYVDPASGKCIEATAKIEDCNADAKNNQQLEVTAKVSSKDEAKTLAEKHLRLHNKYSKSATFTLPGNPALVAGCLGDVIFTVSRNVVRTLDNMTWSGSARYATHERHLTHALTEFTGLDPDKITLVIAQLKKAIAAKDVETMREMLQELLNDLQNTLED